MCDLLQLINSNHLAFCSAHASRAWDEMEKALNGKTVQVSLNAFPKPFETELAAQALETWLDVILAVFFNLSICKASEFAVFNPSHWGIVDLKKRGK